MNKKIRKIFNIVLIILIPILILLYHNEMNIPIIVSFIIIFLSNLYEIYVNNIKK